MRIVNIIQVLYKITIERTAYFNKLAVRSVLAIFISIHLKDV